MCIRDRDRQYTDNIEDDSTNPSKYTWSLIKGADGKTLYTWLKYADSPTSGMSDSPAGKTYMGIAVNKTSITESSNYSDYTWSLIKGTDGISVKGDKGDTVYIWVKYAEDVYKRQPQNISNVGNVTVTNHYDALLNVEGNVDRDALPGLQEILEKSYQYTSKQIVKDARKVGIRPSR